MPHSTQISELFADCLSRDNILSTTETMKPYECDGYTAYKTLPLAVLMPENRQQVIACVRRCREQNIPIVTRGAGTGLSGGAHPIAQGVLLNLSKLNRILEINSNQGYARVEPGVRNAAI